LSVAFMLESSTVSLQPQSPGKLLLLFHTVDMLQATSFLSRAQFLMDGLGTPAPGLCATSVGGGPLYSEGSEGYLPQSCLGTRFSFHPFPGAQWKCLKSISGDQRSNWKGVPCGSGSQSLQQSPSFLLPHRGMGAMPM
jgi:hypothetical protein